MTKKSYYNILGVSENASEAEIDSAYRKLAMKWHPDKWVNKLESEKEEAEKRMKEINQAHKVLSDREKRQNYDRYGSENIFTQGSSSAGDYGRQGPDSFFKDIIDSFFGGTTDYTGQRTYSESRTKSQTGSDVLVDLTLTFKESILGTKKKFSLELEKSCSYCQQTGASSPSEIVECSTCRGRGIVNTIQRTVLGTMRSQKDCDRCQGSGKIIKKKCRQCQGRKFLTQKELIELNIPRGIQLDKRLRYQGLGNDGWYGGEKGDLYVDIKVKDNPYFQRKGNEIHVSLPISFLDAILGNSVEVITLEGIERVLVSPGTQNGDHLVLSGRGCYLGVNKSNRGDLYVWLQVKLPKKITKITEEILNKLQKETNWNPNHEFIEKNKDIVDK